MSNNHETKIETLGHIITKQEVSNAKTISVVQASLLSQNIAYPDKSQVVSSFERKIILFLVALAQQHGESFQPCTIKIKLLGELIGFGLGGGGNYQRLKEDIQNLGKKHFLLSSEPAIQRRWMEKPVFHPGVGTVTLCLHQDLEPFVLKLGKLPKTELFYGDISSLKKRHSVDIYLLLRSALKSGHWLESMEHVSKLLGNAYAWFRLIETNVLLPSIKEINETTDLIVSYTPFYEKRKVIKLEFKIQQKPSKKLRQKKTSDWFNRQDDLLFNPEAVWFQPEYTNLLTHLSIHQPKAYLLLNYLAHNMDCQNTCYCLVDAMVNELHMSWPTIKKYLNVLEELKLVTIEKAGIRNVYHLRDEVFPKGQQEA